MIIKYDSIKSCKETAKMNILVCNFIQNKLILLPIFKHNTFLFEKNFIAFFIPYCLQKKEKCAEVFLIVLILLRSFETIHLYHMDHSDMENKTY